MTNKVKWSDAVKAYGKGRVKKGTEDYNKCKELFEKMKKEHKEGKHEEKHEEKKDSFFSREIDVGVLNRVTTPILIIATIAKIAPL